MGDNRMGTQVAAMSRLPRPHIPFSVRVEVAERQAVRHVPTLAFHDVPSKPLSARLDKLLEKMFGSQNVELHHRPALLNRRRYVRHGETFYDPPANSPDHLVYLPEDEHDIETRVRGQHGQHSDLALARKRKRAEKKRQKSPRNKMRNKIRTKWPSRPLRSASRWPKRKI